MICDTYWDDGRAAGRGAAARLPARARPLPRSSGYEPLLGIEPEFYLLDAETASRSSRPPHLQHGAEHMRPAIERIVEQMRAFGIDIITANCEYAGSQWEIDYGPSAGWPGRTGLHVQERRQGARPRGGLIATLHVQAVRRRRRAAGRTTTSACSTCDAARTRWPTPDGEWGLSAAGRRFIAGQLRHARSIYTLLAPTVNCLKRRRTHTFSPTNVSWGPEDRSAFVRVKGGIGEPSTSRTARPPGCRTHISPRRRCSARASSGIADKLELEPPATPPAEEDPSKPQLPTTVEESLALLEEDADRRAPRHEFVTAYTAMRRHELQRFADHVTDWELEEYLETLLSPRR